MNSRERRRGARQSRMWLVQLGGRPRTGGRRFPPPICLSRRSPSIAWHQSAQSTLESPSSSSSLRFSLPRAAGGRMRASQHACTRFFYHLRLISFSLSIFDKMYTRNKTERGVRDRAKTWGEESMARGMLSEVKRTMGPYWCCMESSTYAHSIYWKYWIAEKFVFRRETEIFMSLARTLVPLCLSFFRSLYNCFMGSRIKRGLRSEANI